MIKVFTIFKGIKDTDSYKKYFGTEILPLALKVPGVTQVNINSLFQMSLDASEEAGGIQFITETFLESNEALDKLITSPEGNKMQQMIKDLPGETSMFLAKVKNFFPLKPDGTSIAPIDQSVNNKIFTIIKDVKDLEKFERVYCNEIGPIGVKVHGVLMNSLNSLFPMMTMSPETSKIQYITITDIESKEVLDYLVRSPEGVKIQEAMVTKLEAGEMSVFLALGKKYFPTN